jgi:hypothetical protein
MTRNDSVDRLLYGLIGGVEDLACRDRYWCGGTKYMYAQWHSRAAILGSV